MYLEVDEHFPTHPKTMKLCARLQNGGAPFYLVKLWSWACGNAKTGDLSDLQPEDIEFTVGWTLMDGKFYAACVDVRLIDEERDAEGKVIRRSIHNWMKRTGGSIVRMEAEGVRKKLLRAHAKKTCGGALSCEFCHEEETRRPTSGGQSADTAEKNGKSAAVSAGCPADKPDQDKASQDKTRQAVSARPPADPRVAGPAPKPEPPPVDPDPDRPPLDFAAPRTSDGLLSLFGHLWGEAKGRDWYGRPKASRAATEFMDRPPPELDKLAPLIRPAMERYLASTKPFYIEREHAFDVFVKDFDALVTARASPPHPNGRPKPKELRVVR